VVEVGKRRRHPLFGLAERVHRAGQRLERAVEPAPGLPGRTLEPARGIDQQRLGTVGTESGMGPRDVLADARGPLHQPPAGIERRFLARLRCQHIELVHRVAQIVLLAAQRGDRGRRLVLRRDRPSPGRPGVPHSRAGPIVATERVEQRPVTRGVQEAPVVLLPVKLDERLGKRPQHLAGDPPIVHPGGLAALGGVQASQDQLVLRRKPRRVEHAPGRVVRPEVEHSRHLAVCRALPDKLRPPPPAQHETERVEQYRLSRPGLAGQHVQARLEAKLQPVDDEHVANVECAEHCMSPIRATRPGSHGPRHPEASLRFRPMA